MKIKRVYLHALHGEEHYQFFATLLPILTAVPAQVMTFIAQFVTALTEWWQREDRALEKIRTSVLTIPIAEADGLRDAVFRGLILMIEGYEHSPLPAEAEAARRVRIVTDHYGNVTRHNYNEETALITNLVQELRERCANELVLLNLTARVNDLEQKNQQFDILMNQRYDEHALIDADTLREVRRSMDAYYQQIIACLEVGSMLPGGEAFDEVIRLINARSEYYRDTIAQRKGHQPQPVDKA